MAWTLSSADLGAGDRKMTRFGALFGHPTVVVAVSRGSDVGTGVWDQQLQGLITTNDGGGSQRRAILSPCDLPAHMH